MNLLLIGSGGREHALAWALAASPLVTKLYCAPGNAGIAEVAACVPIAATELDGIVAFAKKQAIGFVVIGPEAPLVAGLWDLLEANGIKALGPSAQAAQLEGSKGFLKDLCRAHHIPTADYARFENRDAAIAYVSARAHPLVVKADSLAQGKGVVVAQSAAESRKAISELCENYGPGIIIEDFLEGEEASLFVLSDGRDVLPLAGAEDHKRAFDGDHGPNTGGMGAVSPSSLLAPGFVDKVVSRIVRPTIAAMAARGSPYMGVLYAGLMIRDGEPKLVEYNCRFGDPECQVLMLRLKSDLATALLATRDGALGHIDLRWRDEAAVAVVMASKGYPGNYAKGSEIRGLDAAQTIPGVRVFHAATERRNGRLLAAGGRVLNVCATGSDIADARRRSYEAIDRIEWPEGILPARHRRPRCCAQQPMTEVDDRQERFSGTKDVAEAQRFDEARLADYLTAHIDDFARPLTVRQFKGGQSNPTYQLSTPNRNYVLRRKPLGRLLPSAHAVDREYRIISALYPTGFPVAKPYVLCEDESVIGTAFYLMDCVDGRIFWGPLMPELSANERFAIYDALNATLARLHILDFEKLGLGDFGRPGNYIGRQIARWSKQYLASETEPIPEMNKLIDWLPKHLPAEERSTIVHGDFRLDNMILDPTRPEIRAVLDWELSTIGDPLADFTYHLMQWQMPPDIATNGAGSLLNLELKSLGIPTMDAYVAMYCAHTGRPGIPNLDYYAAYNFFRLAGILQGIVGRVRDGTAANENASQNAASVRPLAQRGWHFAERAGANP